MWAVWMAFERTELRSNRLLKNQLPRETENGRRDKGSQKRAADRQRACLPLAVTLCQSQHCAMRAAVSHLLTGPAGVLEGRQRIV